MAIKLYADPITVNCRKVLAGLDLMGAPYERVHVDYFKGEQKLPAYTSINPNASVPALVDGDLVLWESNAILQYAADKLGRDPIYVANILDKLGFMDLVRQMPIIVAWNAIVFGILLGLADLLGRRTKPLDELTYPLRYGWLPLEEVLDTLRARPVAVHVCITGRGAPDELVALADTVTEMRKIKHAYEQGIPAQRGIED